MGLRTRITLLVCGALVWVVESHIEVGYQDMLGYCFGASSWNALRRGCSRIGSS
jgi:hypothetical protein